MVSITRRQMLLGLGAVASGGLARARAQSSDLPLRTSGIEHFGMTVPDPEATATFYGRLFDPQLFQEKDPPPRFYVKIGTGYLAFSGSQTAPPHIDHFCALVEDYRAQEMRRSLEAAGIPLGPGAFGMATDPDGFRLQLLGVPGGLAKTIVPAMRISQDDPVLQAVGPDHVMLRVADLERSAAHYRKLFGDEASRSTGGRRRVWFRAARTRLGLEATAAGESPSIDHVCIRIAGFDRRTAADRISSAGVPLVPSDEEDLLRFRDPNGLIIELTGS